MTNPKHTISDLVERLREDGYSGHNPLCLEAADRIEALEAEVERLRGVLQIITKIRLEGWMSLFGREVRKRIAALKEDTRHG